MKLLITVAEHHKIDDHFNNLKDLVICRFCHYGDEQKEERDSYVLPLSYYLRLHVNFNSKLPLSGVGYCRHPYGF